MMGRTPPPNITPFIDINNDNYHIIAIGTQECGKNITEAMIFPSCEEWEKALQKHLTKKYQMLKSEVMGSIHLAIFINKDCSSHIKNPKAYNVKTGVANVMTNKGAIGISLQFDALTFLFVNSHLTAYQKKVSDRNDDYKRISKGLHMNLNNNNFDQSYDYIFWFGDLNYRINGIRSIVDKLIKENQLEVLLANDQLRIEMNKGNTFNNFSEAPITFRPTYKFDVIVKNDPYNEASTVSGDGKEVSSDPSNSNLLNTTNLTNNITASTTLATSLNIKPFYANETLLESNKENIASNNDTLLESSTQSSLPSQTFQNQSQIQELNVYDTSKKARIPSWTDRILFRVRNQKPPSSKSEFYLPYQNQNNNATEKDDSNTTHQSYYDNKSSIITGNSNTVPNSMNSIRIPLKPVLVEKYTSCENMYWSDHKPVIGSFRIDNDWSSDDIINNKIVHRKTNKACIIQ
ncbi:DNase I-like protein [Neocallimastix californiae]|nr:DNase I-like protein [Neocallimastix californiae]|eukprot:ORY19112.1 DNase I-like protein [Neocallimastix californiae]